MTEKCITGKVISARDEKDLLLSTVAQPSSFRVSTCQGNDVCETKKFLG